MNTTNTTTGRIESIDPTTLIITWDEERISGAV